jgi:hypothetical protein
MNCQYCVQNMAQWILPDENNDSGVAAMVDERPRLCNSCTDDYLSDFQQNQIAELEEYNNSSVIQCVTCYTVTNMLVSLFRKRNYLCRDCVPLAMDHESTDICTGAADCKEPATHDFAGDLLCKCHLQTAMLTNFQPDENADSGYDQVIFPVVMCLFCEDIQIYTTYPLDICCSCEWAVNYHSNYALYS